MSEKKQPAPESSIWQLTATAAELRTAQLCGHIDLRKPLRGLHELTYGATTIEGSVLGVAAGDELVGEDASVEDAFVRGDDLVASYRAGGERPFSLQVYWTVSQREKCVVIDTLLSLETSLLENFPRVTMTTALQGVEVMQPREGREYVVLRSVDQDWSYAEMAHPEDSGEWRVDEKGGIQRSLGGAFLEKGVVRRLRLRGVFLSQATDVQLASECLAELAAQAPPLTA